MWIYYEIIAGFLSCLLVAKIFFLKSFLKRVRKFLPTERADIGIKKINLVCQGIPVARNVVHGAYGLIPFMDEQPGIILEKTSFLIPAFSFAGIKRKILVILIDKSNIIYDTRIYDGSFMSKVLIFLSMPEIVIELDMDKLSLKNPTLIGEKVIIKYHP
jgi:hypothetical protein